MQPHEQLDHSLADEAQGDIFAVANHGKLVKPGYGNDEVLGERFLDAVLAGGGPDAQPGQGDLKTSVDISNA